MDFFAAAALSQRTFAVSREQADHVQAQLRPRRGTRLFPGTAAAPPFSTAARRRAARLRAQVASDGSSPHASGPGSGGDGGGGGGGGDCGGGCGSRDGGGGAEPRAAPLARGQIGRAHV